MACFAGDVAELEEAGVTGTIVLLCRVCWRWLVFRSSVFDLCWFAMFTLQAWRAQSIHAGKLRSCGKGSGGT